MKTNGLKHTCILKEKLKAYREKEKEWERLEEKSNKVTESVLSIYSDMEMDKLINISAKVEISDLENFGWDFSNIYNEVSMAQGISEYEAELWEKSHYHVRLIVDENGIFSYSLCQNAEYGNEEFNQGDPGDVDAAMEDFKKLIESGKVWDLKYY